MRTLYAIAAFASLLASNCLADEVSLRQIGEAALRQEEAEIIASVSDATVRRQVEKLVDMDRVPIIAIRQANPGDICKIATSENARREVPTKTGGWSSANVPVYDLDLRVSNVVDGRNAIVADYSAWIEGMDTSGLTDDIRYDFSKDSFECVGTKQYKTSGAGSRTVKHFVWVDHEKLNPVLKEIRSLRSLRVWLDKSEKHSVVASFVDFEKGNVVMRTRDGKEKSLKISQLSKADQQWVRGAVKFPAFR